MSLDVRHLKSEDGIRDVYYVRDEDDIKIYNDLTDVPITIRFHAEIKKDKIQIINPDLAISLGVLDYFYPNHPNCGMDGYENRKCIGNSCIHSHNDWTKCKFRNYRLSINIKYFDKEIDKIKLVGGKSDWYDLRAAETINLSKGDFKLIPLGVGIKLPLGYEAIIAPRSSTFKNYGIIQTNSIGVIDETYCGDNDEWKLPVYATRDCTINKNDRICQFRIIQHQPPVNIVEVETLGNVNRGGFGSTGTN